jgi:hypothetical protein
MRYELCQLARAVLLSVPNEVPLLVIRRDLGVNIAFNLPKCSISCGEYVLVHEISMIVVSFYFDFGMCDCLERNEQIEGVFA